MALIDIFQQAKHQLKSILDSSAERENETEIIDNICKGINFKGSNLWVLIFAIFIASLGLNVNSTAVIYRRHADIPSHGADYGYRIGSRHQRF